MGVENAVLTAGAVLAMVATIRWMIRANQAEKRSMERRYKEWVDGGSIPEDKPNFFSGNDTGGMSGG